MGEMKEVVAQGGLGAAFFGLVGGLMWLQRKMSQDKLDNTRDSSEVLLLKTIISERNEAIDRADKAWAQRAEDARLIGQLSSEVESLGRINQKTNDEVKLLRMVNEHLKTEMQSLREEFKAMRLQIVSCATCPLRHVPSPGVINEVSKQLEIGRQDAISPEQPGFRDSFIDIHHDVPPTS